LASVTLPTNPSFTIIDDQTFNGCSVLTSITIPNSVTSIGDLAFLGCTSLTLITIPNSVISIGTNAFQSSGLITVTIANGQVGITSPGSAVVFFGATVDTQLPPP
jgi:hypothetical protein